MRFQKLSSVAAISFVTLSAVNGLNILVSNDDGFGTANIRALYSAIKAYGHNVWIVAATSNESGTGGTAVFTNQPNLTADTEFGIVKKGAPSIGQDPMDSHIWYYNGTPSTCVQVALDYVLPLYNLNSTDIDLVLNGVNYGWNLGPFLYTLSGTIGATYTAVERGIPAIGFSGAYSIQTPYYWTNTTTAAGLEDPATIQGKLAASLAQSLINKANGSRILPLGYGINVNIPYITSFTNDSCVDPPFIHTRFTGGADVDKAVFNASSGLFTFGNVVAPGANTCINGDCSLPGETNIVVSCESSVSVFTVDYDAPNCAGSANILDLLSTLVQTNGSSGLVGGLNGTSNSTTGDATTTTASLATASTTAAAFSGDAGQVAGNLVMVIMAFAGLVFVL